MYNIYGKVKDEEKYQLVNVASGDFVNRKIHASLFKTREEAERVCYELEKENEDMFFESRVA